MELRPVSAAEVERICKTWKFAIPGTSEHMKESIDTVGSLGLYVGQDCISWIFNSTSGQLYALQVKPEYRGQGLGEITTAAISKAAAKTGLVPNAHVQLTNSASYSLFEKLGFFCTHTVEEIKYKPK